MRNQARVHLWYPEKHGLPYPALQSSTEGIDRFLTKNTQVGIRRTQGGYDVYAPNGFDDIAGMIVRPNPGPNFSAANYEAKARRWKKLWPEITVLPGGGCRSDHRREPKRSRNAHSEKAWSQLRCLHTGNLDWSLRCLTPPADGGRPTAPRPR